MGRAKGANMVDEQRGGWRWAALFEKEKKRPARSTYLWPTLGIGGTLEYRNGVVGALLTIHETAAGSEVE